MANNFLFRSGVSLPLPPSVTGTPAGGVILSTPATPSTPAPSAGNIAGFTVPHQLESNWCWAAVSLGVDTHYGGAAWTQCSLAGAELGLSCCGSPLPAPCDVPYYLDRALTRVGRFDHYLHGQVSFANLQAEIAADRPLCCRIQWSITGHFVAVFGWSTDQSGTQWVEVQDPDNGYNLQTLADFQTAYRFAGTWSDTYYTCPTAVAVAVVAAVAAPATPMS
jgi:hypothetical protein